MRDSTCASRQPIRYERQASGSSEIGVHVVRAPTLCIGLPSSLLATGDDRTGWCRSPISDPLGVSNWEFSRRSPDSATLLVARRLTYADPHIVSRPPGFSWGSAELFVPIGRQALLPRGDHRLTVIGRLRDGVTLDGAHAELTSIAAALAAQYPEDDKGWTVRTASLYEWLIPAPVRESLLVLLGAVGIVLIVGRGITLTAAGAAIGVTSAFWLTRMNSSMRNSVLPTSSIFTHGIIWRATSRCACR